MNTNEVINFIDTYCLPKPGETMASIRARLTGKEVALTPYDQLMMQEIIPIIEAGGYELDLLRSPSCCPGVVRCRFVFWYFCRAKYPFIPLAVIGRFVGKEHSDVLYGIRTVNNIIDTKNKEYAELINRITTKTVLKWNAKELH